MSLSQHSTHSNTPLRRAIIAAALFSGMVNLLGLTGPLFMLEVYDRVIPSRSLPTLVALLLLVAGLYAFSAILDIVRGRVMIRIAGAFDASLSSRVFALIAGAPLRTRSGTDALRPAQELDQIRTFLAGPGPIALFDLPWMPVYLVVCFLLHPLIGWLTAAAMVVLALLTIITDITSRRHTRDASAALSRRNAVGEASYRDAEGLAAMGMLDRATVKWDDAHAAYAMHQRQAADIGGTLSGISRALRYMLQSSALALGAYLVLNGQMSAGMIVAASIIVTRTLAPVEQVIGNWRNFVGARQAWKRLRDILALFPEEAGRIAIPAPKSTFAVEALFAGPPGERRLTVQNVGFAMKAGSVVGVVGPSGSGKSSLARAIVGIWPLARGRVTLDGAGFDQWSAADRGRYIGYMPQAVELFPGTIAENIARLDPDADDETIVAAAKAAGVHDLVVQLPDGYETRVGDNGMGLSAGQRQRVALARALYGDPFLVVLDEPNSNLDTEGEKALSLAIQGVRDRGGIVVVVAHRTSVLAVLDFVLIMEAGVVKSFGPREAVLRPAPRQVATTTLKVIDTQEAQA